MRACDENSPFENPQASARPVHASATAPIQCAILVGLQASGKTTFFHRHLGMTHEHVSKDLMPNARHRTARQQAMLADAFGAGRSVAVDNTNPTPDDRRPLIEIARARGAQVIGYYFDCSVQESLRRNAARHGRQRVPDVAVFATASRLTPPALEEGFDRLYRVRLLESGEFEVIEMTG